MSVEEFHRWLESHTLSAAQKELITRWRQSTSPQKDSLLVDLATALIRERKFRMAIHILEFCTQRGAHPRTFTLLGRAYRKEGRLEEALWAIQQALDLNPDHPANHYEHALTLKLMGRLIAALKEMSSVLERDHHDGSMAPIVKDYALLLDEIGLSREALTFLENYAQGASGNKDYLTARALVLYSMGRHQESLMCCEQCLEHFPSDAARPLWERLTVENLLSTGRLEEALQKVEALLVKNREKKNLYLKGVILSSSGRYAEAIPCFSEAIEGNLMAHDYYMDLGLALKKSGNLAGARETIQRGMNGCIVGALILPATLLRIVVGLCEEGYVAEARMYLTKARAVSGERHLRSYFFPLAEACIARALRKQNDIPAYLMRALEFGAPAHLIAALSS